MLHDMILKRVELVPEGDCREYRSAKSGGCPAAGAEPGRPPGRPERRGSPGTISDRRDESGGRRGRLLRDSSAVTARWSWEFAGRSSATTTSPRTPSRPHFSCWSGTRRGSGSVTRWAPGSTRSRYASACPPVGPGSDETGFHCRQHPGPNSAEAGNQAPIAEAERREMAELVHAEIGRLPPRLRSCVVLCDLEGMTYAQAARTLGVPIGTVQSRLARARMSLRKRLADWRMRDRGAPRRTSGRPGRSLRRGWPAVRRRSAPCWRPIPQHCPRAWNHASPC